MPITDLSSIVADRAADDADVSLFTSPGTATTDDIDNAPGDLTSANTITPKVLARKMPDTFKSEPAKRIYTLHSMVSKAVYSSRILGRVEPRVRTEKLDSPIPEVHVAACPLPKLYQRCLWLQNTPWNTICDLPFIQRSRRNSRGVQDFRLAYLR